MLSSTTCAELINAATDKSFKVNCGPSRKGSDLTSQRDLLISMQKLIAFYY